MDSKENKDQENLEHGSYHFTYCKSNDDNLQQGDIIQKTEEIQLILKDFHPHYFHRDNYTHFIVLTQSCHLIKRDSDKCDAQYINLAAVRPLDLVLQREIIKYQGDEFKQKANVCSNKVKFKVEQLLETLFNNNHKEYFYLHKDYDLNFPESSCAFLRLSIALKAEHYDSCLRARLFSLKDVFKAKLGWLIGTMYSMVGTEEWLPDNSSETEFKQTIQDLLDNVCEWVDEEQLKIARKRAGEAWKYWCNDQI
jgi:hypothetical protein